MIHSSDLPEIVQPNHLSTEENNSLKTATTIMSLDDVEYRYLFQVCEQFQGSPAELAIKLNISVRTLYRKLQRYDLKLTAL